MTVLAALLAGGLAHRTGLRDERADRVAVYAAVHRYVVRAEPEFLAGLPYLSTRASSSPITTAPASTARTPSRCACSSTPTSRRPGVKRDPAREANEQVWRWRPA